MSFLGFVISQGQLSPDQAKVQAVTDWLVPSSCKELQHFLGFANFYHRFIRNYSAVAAPLTALTSTVRRFAWTQEAQTVFDHLKVLFTSAPILSYPDPSLPFTVEVDTSETGVWSGALAAQHHGSESPSLRFFQLALIPCGVQL